MTFPSVNEPRVKNALVWFLLLLLLLPQLSPNVVVVATELHLLLLRLHYLPSPSLSLPLIPRSDAFPPSFLPSPSGVKLQKVLSLSPRREIKWISLHFPFSGLSDHRRNPRRARAGADIRREKVRVLFEKEVSLLHIKFTNSVPSPSSPRRRSLSLPFKRESREMKRG